MTQWNIIAGVLIIVFVGIIIGLQVYKKNKNSDKAMTMDEFLDAYSDNIIKALKDTIQVLSVNLDSYDTKEEYEADIVKNTILALKENAKGFGIDENIINLFDEETLTNLIMKCLKKNSVECFEVLPEKTIMANTSILENEVVEAVAKESNSTSTN